MSSATSQSAFNRAQALHQAPSYPSAERAANWLLGTIGRPDVIVVLGFCAIGLIATFAALAQFADLSSALEQIGNMP